jgi:outer membrane lipoprotein-sorting protein
MKSINSIHFVSKVDAAGTSTSGEGDIVKPDKIRITSTSATGKSEIIVIGSDIYSQVPGTDTYVHTGGGDAMLGSMTAVSLVDLAENATVVGDETLDGIDTTHIKYSYSLDKAADMAAQAAGQANATPSTGLGEADAEIWIEKSTGYVHQTKTTSSIASVSSTTTTTFSKFNEAVTPPIEKPANVQEMPEIPTIPSPCLSEQAKRKRPYEVASFYYRNSSIYLSSGIGSTEPLRDKIW